MIRTLLAALLALLVACEGVAPAEPTSPSPSGQPPADGFAAELRADRFGDGTVQQVIDVLADAGVATYEHAESTTAITPPSEPAVPVQLLRDQVRSMALEAWAGGGIPASVIDDILPGEPDLAPASYILAGYVAAVDTPSAEVARSLMGVQDLEAAPNLVFPQLVLTLFVADIVRDRATEAHAQSGEGIVLAAAHRPQDATSEPLSITGITSPCSAVSAFISSVLTRVFDAIKFDDPGAGGTAVMKTIWNWVVTVLEVVTQTIIRQFGEPVLNLIGRAAGVVATIATVVSAVRPWAVTVTPEPWTREKGIAGIQPTQEGILVVRVDLGGYDTWPEWIEDCARATDRPLPNLKPDGTPVSWDPLIQNPSDLVRSGGGDGKLDARGTARLHYTTLTDDVEAPYRTLGGTILGRVSLERQSIRDLAKIAEDELLGGLTPQVRNLIWGPILKPHLDAAIKQLSRLIAYHSTGGAGILYHVQEATPTPSVVPTLDPKAEFCDRYRALLRWWFLEATNIGTQAWAAEIVWRFEEMRRFAPLTQRHAVDVHIGLYTAYATLSGPQAVKAAVPWAEQMPDAVASLDSYCGITPADRGGAPVAPPTVGPDSSQRPPTPRPSQPPTPPPGPALPTPSGTGTL